jgi:hypothetical protein
VCVCAIQFARLNENIVLVILVDMLVWSNGMVDDMIWWYRALVLSGGMVWWHVFIRPPASFERGRSDELLAAR